MDAGITDGITGIDVTQPPRIKGQRFTLDILMENQVYRLAARAMNLESMLTEMAIATMANLDRVAGFNVYDSEGRLLASVPAHDFNTMLASAIPLGNFPSTKMEGKT